MPIPRPMVLPVSHIFVLKYRQYFLDGQLRRSIGDILRELYQQQGVTLVEGHAMPDHPYSSGVFRTRMDLHRVAFLSVRLLRQHGRTG
jgi:REP element-mobilizing transposase RayT